MSDLLDLIQRDILDTSADLTIILLKAKVLAQQLRNDTFKRWVRSELDGYPESLDVPDYRILDASLRADLSNGFYYQNNTPISISNLPSDLQERAEVVRFTGSVRVAEEFSKKSGLIRNSWGADWIGLWNYHNRDILNTYTANQIYWSIAPESFGELVLTVRSRLQDFILELGDNWSVGRAVPPTDNIERLLSVTILNQNGKGSMSAPTFDQRHQQVQNQNNAARDVNLSGGVNITTQSALAQALNAMNESLHTVETEKQEETKSAIALLEQATQQDVTKSQVVQAVEVISQTPTLREHLTSIAVNASGSAAGAAIVEAIRFVLHIPS